MAGDADFDKVVLLLHCDGANGSTTFTDNSPSPKTVTAYGDAKVSTAQSKFGGASAYFDGVGDYLTVPNTTDLQFGTGDFTVEGWIRCESITGKYVFLCLGTYYQVTSGIVFYFVDGKIAAYSGTSPFIAASASISANTWTHVAWARSGATLRLFTDGVLRHQAELSAHLSPTGSPPTIGQDAQYSNMLFFGHIDDLRITKGAARYTANFTPPTAPFPDRAPQLSGNVKNASSANAARLVRAVREDTGAFVGSATSDAGTGNYTIVCSSYGAHSLIAYPAAGEDLPALVHHGVIPI